MSCTGDKSNAKIADLKFYHSLLYNENFLEEKLRN